MKINKEAFEVVVRELFTERRAKILLENSAMAEKLGITPDVLIPTPIEDVVDGWTKGAEIDPRLIKFLKEPMGEGKGFATPRSLDIVKRFRRRTYL